MTTKRSLVIIKCMDGAKNVALAVEKLTLTSKSFLDQFLGWKPKWVKYCTMDQAPYGCDLRIEIPSPTGNPDLTILIWFAADQEDISIGFGNWHTHGNMMIEISHNEYEDWSVLEVTQLIVNGDLVSYTEAPEFATPMGILFLPNKYEMLDELTSESSSGIIRIQSWDGNKDREVSVNDWVE